MTDIGNSFMYIVSEIASSSNSKLNLQFIFTMYTIDVWMNLFIIVHHLVHA